MRKIFTALITMVSILMLVGLTATAFATSIAPAEVYTIDQKMTESMTQVAAITGQTSVAPEQATMAGEFTVAKTIVASNSDTAKMADQIISSKRTEQAEVNLISPIVAESVPKYIAAKIDGTPNEAMKDSMADTMIQSKIGKIALVWQNGGGPAVGVAPIAGSEMAVEIGKKAAGGVVILV